jgi:hypothetical protein
MTNNAMIGKVTVGKKSDYSKLAVLWVELTPKTENPRFLYYQRYLYVIAANVRTY